MKRTTSGGFTLVEIMIVVLIIAVLTAIAIPAFMNAREQGRTKACVNNLRQISSAKMQYCLTNKLSGTATIPGGMTTLVGSASYLRATPVCPSQGTYTLNTIDIEPTCSIGASGAGQFAAGGSYYHGLP